MYISFVYVCIVHMYISFVYAKWKFNNFVNCAKCTYFPRNAHIFCLCVYRTYRTYPPSYHMYPRIALFVSCTHTSPCLSHCIVRGFHRYVDIVCVRVYRTYLLSYISVLCTRAPVRAPGKEYPFFYLGAPVQLKYAKYTKNDSGLWIIWNIWIKWNISNIWNIFI